MRSCAAPTRRSALGTINANAVHPRAPRSTPVHEAVLSSSVSHKCRCIQPRGTVRWLGAGARAMGGECLATDAFG